MTKCIVLGKDNSVQPAKKPIQFVKQLLNSSVNTDDAFRIGMNYVEPGEFDYVELVCPRRTNIEEYDIMFAYDEDRREEGVLFLGFWNDGVV